MISLAVKLPLTSVPHFLRNPKSFPFCSYKIVRPQLLQNEQIRNPLVTADSKAISTPLESAVTDIDCITLLDSAVTKKWGWGIPPKNRVFARHSSLAARLPRASSGEGPFSSGTIICARLGTA